MSNSRDDTPRRPAALDSVIRFLVWSAVLGTLAGPVLLIALFNSQIIVSFPFLGDNRFIQTTRTLIPSPRPSTIVTIDGTQLAQEFERLRSLTARPEMTSGSIVRLNIVAIAFDEEKPEPTPPGSPVNGHAVDPDGYRRLSIDLAGLPHDGVVLIADQPIRWVVSGLGSASGRIGFEGLAPFDVVNGRAGMLAGFRIAAFGARGTARAEEPSLDDKGLRDLCTSMREWAEHFGIPTGQTTFTLFMNPTAVGSNDGAIISNGQTTVSWTRAIVESLCKAR